MSGRGGGRWFSCILGELFVKKPIFQGNSEAIQLDTISQTCGTPTPNVWPNVVHLPFYNSMRPRQYYNRTLVQKFAL